MFPLQQNDADSIQLGPGGGAGRFAGWHRGSTGGGVDPERPTTPSNRLVVTDILLNNSNTFGVSNL